MHTRHALALACLLLLESGCQSLGRSAAPSAEALQRMDRDTLVEIVSELEMHLREDAYRYDRATTSDGRDVVSVALWKLERLQRLRAVSPPEWQNADLVLEFARARALTRLRHFDAALDAFERVAASGSILATPAFDAARTVQRFAAASAHADAALDVADIRARAMRWRALAAEHAGTGYESLALEEAEAWETLLVDQLERTQGAERALASCLRLIELNHASKLYSRHLIRLGDLYTDLARGSHARSRTSKSADLGPYEQLVDRALAAYELASEDRRPGLRGEAKARIEALLAAHRGVLADAR